MKSVIGRVSMFETGDMAAGWDTERVVEVRRKILPCRDDADELAMRICHVHL